MSAVSDGERAVDGGVEGLIEDEGHAPWCGGRGLWFLVLFAAGADETEESGTDDFVFWPEVDGDGLGPVARLKFGPDLIFRCVFSFFDVAWHDEWGEGVPDGGWREDADGVATACSQLVAEELEIGCSDTGDDDVFVDPFGPCAADTADDGEFVGCEAVRCDHEDMVDAVVFVEVEGDVVGVAMAP